MCRAQAGSRRATALGSGSVPPPQKHPGAEGPCGSVSPEGLGCWPGRALARGLWRKSLQSHPPQPLSCPRACRRRPAPALSNLPLPRAPGPSTHFLSSGPPPLAVSQARVPQHGGGWDTSSVTAPPLEQAASDTSYKPHAAPLTPCAVVRHRQLSPTARSREQGARPAGLGRGRGWHGAAPESGNAALVRRRRPRGPQGRPPTLARPGTPSAAKGLQGATRPGCPKGTVPTALGYVPPSRKGQSP